jgi:hypothetical protein
VFADWPQRGGPASHLAPSDAKVDIDVALDVRDPIVREDCVVDRAPKELEPVKAWYLGLECGDQDDLVELMPLDPPDEAFLELGVIGNGMTRNEAIQEDRALTDRQGD